MFKSPYRPEWKITIMPIFKDINGKYYLIIPITAGVNENQETVYSYTDDK